MNKHIIPRTALSLLLLGGTLQSCNQEPEFLASPATNAAQQEVKVSLSVAQAQSWYEQYLPVAETAARGATRPVKASKPLVLDWNQAERVRVGAQELLLVPIGDTRDRFKRTPYQGLRRLVISQQPEQAPTGVIIEVIADKKTANSIVQNTFFARLYAQQQTTQLSNLTGAVLYYTPGYEYITGQRYEQGEAQVGMARLIFRQTAVPSPVESGPMAFRGIVSGDDGDETDEIDGGETGEVIIIGSAPNPPSFPSGPITIPGGGDYGGWGGGPADSPNDPGGGSPGGGGGASGSEDTAELQQYETEYKSRMSADEISIYNSMSRLQQIKYLMNAKTAESRADALFSSSLNNGKGDAFRHALFSALNTLYLGKTLAKSLGDAHENGALPTNPDDMYMYYLSKNMDLFNNGRGRDIIGTGGSPEQNVLNLLNTGQLLIIEGNVLVPSHP